MPRRYNRRASRPSRGMRVFRAMSARQIEADYSRMLVTCPIWPGETVKWIRMDAYCQVLGGAAGYAPEINWRGMIIPAGDISAAVTPQASGALHSDSIFTSAFDAVYGSFARDPMFVSDQHYGGDSDAETTQDEVLPALGDRRVHASQIDNFFRREVFMRPVGGATDTTDWADSFNVGISKNMYRSTPSFLIFGVHRYEHSAETNFNWEDANILSIPGGTQTSSIGRMIWDTEFVNHVLREVHTGSDASEMEASRWLAHALTGDNYIESGKLEDNDGQAYVKMQIGIATPIVAPVLGNT